MDPTSENATRPSGLRQPMTRLPQLGGSTTSHGLYEMTDSQHNARHQTSSLPQVAAGFKRSVQQPAAQPEPKRQTLVEKAAEYPSRAPMTSLPGAAGRGHVRGLSLKDVNKSSYTGTGLPRTANIPNNSHSNNSLNGSQRPPSRSHVRTRSNATRNPRPATSMGTREDSRGQNGTTMPPPPPFEPAQLALPKVRKHRSDQDMSAYEKPLPAAREASICDKLSRLDINTQSMSPAAQGPGARVTSRPTTPPSCVPQRHSLIPTSVGYKSRWQQTRGVNSCDTQTAPLTPTQLQVNSRFATFETALRDSMAGSSIAYSSPKKAPCPPYLTRFSNTRGFAATDIDERLGKVDTELQRMKEFMDSTATDKDRILEERDAAKTRAAQLQTKRDQLQDDLDDAKRELQSRTREVQYLTEDLDKQKRNYQEEIHALGRKHLRELEEERRVLSVERESHEELVRQFEDKCGREARAQREQLERDIEEHRSKYTTLRHEKDLETQRLGLELRQCQLLLSNAEGDLAKTQEQVQDQNRTISLLTARVGQLEQNAETLQEAYGSSENRKDQEIGDMSRKMQDLQRRADESERLAFEAEKEAKRKLDASRDEMDSYRQGLQQKLVLEEEKRRKLFEQVQDLKGNIRVMCRIRPAGKIAVEDSVNFDLLPSEYDEDKFAGVVVPTEKDHFQDDGRKVLGKTSPFNFERIFNDDCTNNEVFDEIGQLVQSVMDGKRVCIFCYGQTGSGKTYTMSNQLPNGSGDPDQGVIPRAKHMVFDEVERLRSLGWEYTVEASYLEVYKNKLYDLLAPRTNGMRPLEVKKVADDLEIKDHDFTVLQREQDLDDMVKTAENNRHVAETNMNRASSRSHSILVLKIRGKKDLGGGKFKTREGTLNLIDLAGSESVGRSGATGDVAEEGRQINMSLTHLGTVLKQLGEGRKKESVDFSSYTLTQLLRPSLGEKCRTLMFVMISPLKENVKETISSLKFAENAQKVKQNGGSKGTGLRRINK